MMAPAIIDTIEIIAIQQREPQKHTTPLLVHSWHRLHHPSLSLATHRQCKHAQSEQRIAHLIVVNAIDTPFCFHFEIDEDLQNQHQQQQQWKTNTKQKTPHFNNLHLYGYSKLSVFDSNGTNSLPREVIFIIYFGNEGVEIQYEPRQWQMQCFSSSSS